MKRHWKMAFLIHVVALLFASLAHAKVMAFACAWEDGDIVFATDVAEDQTELTRTYDVEGVSHKIKITNLKSRLTHATLTLSSKSKISVKTVACLLETE